MFVSLFPFPYEVLLGYWCTLETLQHLVYPELSDPLQGRTIIPSQLTHFITGNTWEKYWEDTSASQGRVIACCWDETESSSMSASLCEFMWKTSSSFWNASETLNIVQEMSTVGYVSLVAGRQPDEQLWRDPAPCSACFQQASRLNKAWRYISLTSVLGITVSCML